MNGPIDTTAPAMADQQPVLVRPSRDGDVEAMLTIYRQHIRRGIEESVDDSGTPEPDDLRDRRKNLRNHRLPHLVATCGGEVVGYATASAPVDADAISSGGALTDTIDAALREAGWVAADVQRVINASMCDSRFLGIERAAVARTIGSRAGRPCVVEFTSKLGHALGAAGAIDAALGVALASRGADSRDCAILCNALGYSGQAASLAILAAPGAGVGRLAS